MFFLVSTNNRLKICELTRLWALTPLSFSLENRRNSSRYFVGSIEMSASSFLTTKTLSLYYMRVSFAELENGRHGSFVHTFRYPVEIILRAPMMYLTCNR